MASTNKTANLALNQWTLDDPFLMEDFNADNRKLDVAIGGVESRKAEFIKLKDITTTVQAEEVEINISDVHMEQYSLIAICVARIGSGGAKLAFYPCERQNYTMPGSSYYDNDAHASLGSTGENNIILFFPMRDGTKNLASVSLGIADSVLCNGRSVNGRYGQTTHMKILPAGTDCFTNPGTRIRIWGMK